MGNENLKAKKDSAVLNDVFIDFQFFF